MLINLVHFNFSARKIATFFKSDLKILKVDNFFKTTGEFYKYTLDCEGLLLSLKLLPKSPLLYNEKNIMKIRTIESDINIYYDSDLVFKYEKLKPSIIRTKINRKNYIRSIKFDEIFIAPGFFCNDLDFEVSVINSTKFDFTLVISESNNH